MADLSDRKMYLILLGIVAVVFFGFCIFGYVTAVANPETGNASTQAFQQVVKELDSDNSGVLAWQIFFNNLKVCLILFIGGITFGAATVYILSQNGYIIGSISEVMLRHYDTSVFAATLVPHGIFEISAILMSAALGLQMACALLLDGAGLSNAGNMCVWYGKRFFLVVIPLLIIAALVETFVSPVVADLVLAGF